MPKVISVNFSLPGALRHDHATNTFVSYCPALDLYSAGKNRPDAKKALQGAVELFVRICYDRGILDDVLNKRGFKIAAGLEAGAAHDFKDFITVMEIDQPQASEPFDDLFDVEVPLSLVADRSLGAAVCQQ